MPGYRCQECGYGISRHCRKCPQCCARSPIVRRPSPMAIFVAMVLLGCAVFVIKNVHFDDPGYEALASYPAARR